MAILRQHCIAVHLKVGPSVMRSISVDSKGGGGPSHLYSPDGEFSSLSVGRVLGSPGESRGSGIGYICRATSHLARMSKNCSQAIITRLQWLQSFLKETT